MIWRVDGIRISLGLCPHEILTPIPPDKEMKTSIKAVFSCYVLQGRNCLLMM